MEQYENADGEETFIVKEMLNDMKSHFNNDDDYHANQQLIGHKDLFRGVIVKHWAIDDHSGVNFHPHNKVLI